MVPANESSPIDLYCNGILHGSAPLDGQHGGGCHLEPMIARMMRDLSAMCAEVAGAVALMQGRGDRNLYYVDGTTLFGPDLVEMLPDDLHPDAEGYQAMGRNFVEKVAAPIFGRAPVTA